MKATGTLSLVATTYLDSIVATHRRRAQRDERDWRERRATIRSGGPSFDDALRDSRSGYVHLIAEVKRRSPSKGWLAPDLDAAATASLYEKMGASAVSVLTDDEYFAGSLEDLRRVRERVALPLLRKDFTVSENDVLDAAEAGASAVLLIVAALEQSELEDFFHLAHEVNLAAVVEVHDAEEARRALDVGATIIGVNQRDLTTFDVDPTRAAAVVEFLGSGTVKICESGLRTVDDVVNAARAGFDAVLVGESFVVAPDPGPLVHSFATVSVGA